MTTKVHLNNGRIILPVPQNSGGAIISAQPLPGSVPTQPPVTLPGWPQGEPSQPSQGGRLAQLLQDGWQRYGRCIGAWVAPVKRHWGYEPGGWEVCAVAAAYLGAYPNETAESIRWLDDHKAAVGLAPALGYSMKDAKVPSIRRERYGQISWLLSELVVMNDEGWPPDLIIQYAAAAERHLVVTQ